MTHCSLSDRSLLLAFVLVGTLVLQGCSSSGRAGSNAPDLRGRWVSTHAIAYQPRVERKAISTYSMEFHDATYVTTKFPLFGTTVTRTSPYRIEGTTLVIQDGGGRGGADSRMAFRFAGGQLVLQHAREGVQGEIYFDRAGPAGPRPGVAKEPWSGYVPGAAVGRDPGAGNGHSSAARAPASAAGVTVPAQPARPKYCASCRREERNSPTFCPICGGPLRER